MKGAQATKRFNRELKEEKREEEENGMKILDSRLLAQAAGLLDDRRCYDNVILLRKISFLSETYSC